MKKVCVTVWVIMGLINAPAAVRVPPPPPHVTAPYPHPHLDNNDNNNNHTIEKTNSSVEGSGLGVGWVQSPIYIYPTFGFGVPGFLHTDMRFRRDPLELSGMEEGDILPHPTSHIRKENGLQNKIAVRENIKLWAGAVVPYEFSFEYGLFPIERMTIRRVMRDISKHSCIRFVERTDQEDYLKIIVDRDKCYSYVGRIGGVQQLSLGVLCATWLDIGPIYHELLHALGFYHEHNRPDRDQHIEVNWDNIAEGSEKNFVKRDVTSVELLDLPYDIDSVMHYSPFTFSKWSFLTPTLKSKKKGYNFWRKTSPSKTDYLKLNRLYGCRRGRRQRWMGRAGLPSRGAPVSGGHGFTPRQPGRWQRQYYS